MTRTGFETFQTRDGIPISAKRVTRLQFGTGGTKYQVIYDGWRGRDRLCVKYGPCVSCGRICYGFSDGENDPRGMLGDHAVSMFYASDYDATGPDVVACFMCQNDYDRYNYGLGLARKRWTDAS